MVPLIAVAQEPPSGRTPWHSVTAWPSSSMRVMGLPAAKV
jgi:hypothetical protein